MSASTQRFSRWSWIGGMRISSSAMMTAHEREAVDARSTHAAPRVAKTTPPMAGPMTRARLNCIEFIATAFGTSSRLTSSGSSEM